MFKFDSNFCNKIAQLSINKFNELPKTGKPNSEEWTILSCIAKHDNTNNDLEIVSLGTGTKCIGANKMSPNGDILNDSHAEIICRRAFMRYLYDQIIKALNEKDSIFLINDKQFILHKSLSFHFFTTHIPCGDAAIFPKQNSDEFGNCVADNSSHISKKRPREADKGQSDKKIKIESCINISASKEEINQRTNSDLDIFRTGAKCLANDTKQDSKLSGLEYHTRGAVRIKPGRGDPTLSVSCSDKLAKWTFLGIQGALLSFLLSAPIYLSTFTIAASVPFSEESLLRSLKTRFSSHISSSVYHHKVPSIWQADVSFSFCKADSKRPCPTSVIWCNVPLKPLEISVDGKKQGVTKKNRNKKEGRLFICKRELFSTFMHIIKTYKLNLEALLPLTYRQVKQKSEYFNVWNTIKSEIFCIWTVKNIELLNFSADE